MELTEISYTRRKQTTIHRRKPNGSVEVLLVEFDRKNSHKDRAIEDRYVICPNEVIMLEKRTQQVGHRR